MKSEGGGYDAFTLDIEVYTHHGVGHWAQARYLVHGIDDVVWTNDVDEAIAYLKQELIRVQND